MTGANAEFIGNTTEGLVQLARREMAEPVSHATQTALRKVVLSAEIVATADYPANLPAFDPVNN